MAARDVLKFINLFVDGRGHAGQLEEYSPPALTSITEDHRAGGMNMAVDIDMGVEKMTVSAKLTSYDANVLALWGLRSGAGVNLTVKASMESHDGTKTPVTHNMRGKLTGLNPGAWGGGAKPTLELTASLDFFRETIGGRVVQEIDAINMIHIVDGVDQLAEHRANIGI